MDRQEITSILAGAGLRPQHKFGQNFMVDQKVLRAIAEAGDIGPQDVVLEVGPGVGNLTRLLSQRAAAVLAVDIDYKLMPAARRYHAALTNVTWLNADVLAGKHAVNPDVIETLRGLHARHPLGEVKLVSNLPYNAASPLIAELLVFMWGEGSQAPRHKGTEAQKGLEDAQARRADPEHPPLLFSLLAFTVQYEVAERMAAAPDTSDYGPLGILIQLTADVEILRKIPPGAFWPPPKIHSALVRVRPNRQKMDRIPDVLALQSLLSGLFSHRRQTLHNALKHHLGDRYTPALKEAIAARGIDRTLRPEALPLEAFLTLATLASS